MKQILQEFKQFAMRGNVVDMAVGIIIGGAFTAIVNSLVNDIINPLLGLFGGMNFDKYHLQLAGDVTLNYGAFITAIINALSRKKKEEKPATPPAPPADIQLLTEIRDLLKTQK